MIIGLSGLARSGKDAFCRHLITELSPLVVKRFALADALKAKLFPFIMEHFGKDITTCAGEDKENLRDIMVAFGKAKRRYSNGEYWTGLLEAQILSDSFDVAIVTDIRYDIYPQDEVWWIKEHMHGTLVHISRYEEKDGERIWIKPPNNDEATNDVNLKCKADYRIEWPTVDEEGQKTHAKEFAKYLEIYARSK
jgi:hypothetical protein